MRLFGFQLTKILGRSMQPRLQPGCYALFGPFQSLQAGDIVRVEHPRLGPIVKSIHTLHEDRIDLIGLHPSSTPAVELTNVPMDWVCGRLLGSVAPRTTR